jgi:NAD(P)-dependent dehydrogenase (short-subunit alcohol dehydrogenase family)
MAEAVATQKRNLPLLATRETCGGKTYIVTGANTGLGFEAARRLAIVGAAKVILAVRNPATGEAAKAEIDEAAGTEGTGVVEVWPLDLASFDSVRAFAKRATAELDRIDALIANAALALEKREEAEGHHKVVTVNVLSTFLLAVLLLPEMSRKAKGREDVTPRLVIVSSRVGFNFREAWEKIKENPIKGMDAEDFETPNTSVSTLSFNYIPYSWMMTDGSAYRYPVSKLTETFATRYFAPNVVPVEKTGVIVNIICPGLCVTKLGRRMTNERAERLRTLQAQYGRSAEDGSRTLLHGAVAGVESHGKLLHSCEDGEYV